MKHVLTGSENTWANMKTQNCTSKYYLVINHGFLNIAKAKQDKEGKDGKGWKQGVLKTAFLRNMKRCSRRCIFGKGGLCARREVELLWPWVSCACFLSDIPDSWVGKRTELSPRGCTGREVCQAFAVILRIWHQIQEPVGKIHLCIRTLVWPCPTNTLRTEYFIIEKQTNKQKIQLW